MRERIKQRMNRAASLKLVGLKKGCRKSEDRQREKESLKKETLINR